MNIDKAKVTNFGSYSELEIDFSNQGLALIYGPTGAGKSTLLDIPCWILFGQTAKGGNVDEIRSWKNPKSPTTGCLSLRDTSGHTITVYRCRGGINNDLYWTEVNTDQKHRGKDITETQKLLEARLGVSYTLYNAGSYFHEHGITSNFFISKAKDRRQILESLAPLSLPIRIADRALEAKRNLKKEHTSTENTLSTLEARHSQLIESRRLSESESAEWATRQAAIIQELEVRFQNFEIEKTSKIQVLTLKAERWEQEKAKQIDILVEKINKLEGGLKPIEYYEKALQQRCNECGGPKNTKAEAKYREALDKYNKAEQTKEKLLSQCDLQNPHVGQLEAAKSLENTYGLQLELESKKLNPFISQINKMTQSLVILKGDVRKAKDVLSTLSHKLVSVSAIYDLSFKLKAELMKRSVKELQDETNRILNKHFNAEIRVEFDVSSGDDLEVSLFKSGYDAVYTQLSKGQRCMLKLAFGLAVMKQAANNAGVHFPSVFMDEPLGGLDPELKANAHSLFEELSLTHESVFVIEHSRELEQMFSKRYHVSLVDDVSVIEQEA